MNPASSISQLKAAEGLFMSRWSDPGIFSGRFTANSHGLSAKVTGRAAQEF